MDHLLSIIPRKAILSPDRMYRYVIWREWGEPGCPYVLFVGLNPSTADETHNDPTIRRCINFARDWGYGAMAMSNLFAFRATYPEDMRIADEPVGPETDAWLARLSAEAAITIAAWGCIGAHQGRDQVVLRMLRDPHCLGVTKGGLPRHPLYVPACTRPSMLSRNPEGIQGG